MKKIGNILVGAVAGVILSLMFSAVAMPPNYGNAVLMGSDAGNGVTNPVNNNTPLPVMNVAPSALNNVSGVAVVVKPSPGIAVRVNVLSASGVGAVYDSATVASGVASTQVFAIPAAVGTYEIDWPMKSGIVVNPSSSVISISYQ